MIFRYTNLDGAEKSVDTESAGFIRRLNWLKEHGAPDDHSLLFGVNITPKTKDGDIAPGDSITQTGTIVWQEDGFPFGTDVYLTFVSPEVALIEILRAFGRAIPAVHPRYTDPEPPNPGTEDWLSAGSPVGQPLPGQAGKYQSRYTGGSLGDVWVGPSGARYELRRSGGAFGWLYWQLL